MKEKLKVGILLNDYLIPFWEYRILGDIKNSDFAEIGMVIMNTPGQVHPESKGSALAGGIIKIIEKCDRAIFRTNPDFNLVKDAGQLLADIPVISLKRRNGDENMGQRTNDLLQIQNFSPDIILKFGVHDSVSDLLKIPRYGIWAYSLDTPADNSEINKGFREVINRELVTESTLTVLNSGNGDPETIFRCMESTCPFSMNINRDRIAWRSSLFATRIMEGLHHYGDDYLTSLKTRFRSYDHERITHFESSALLPAVGSIFKYIARVTKSIVKKILYTDDFTWQLLIDIKAGSNSYSADFGNFKVLSSPGEVFWADPFVVAGDNCYYIFVEEYIYKNFKAHISVLKLDSSGKFLSSERIIERPYHMSYPSVFKIDGTYYMIPETCKNRTVELYRCTDFPDKWEFDRNLMENLSAVDSTLFHHNNKWWLFTSIDQTGHISGCSTELFLFYADDIFSGKWESHPCNPVVSDVRIARQAGNLFIKDGEIYRPSQNCAGRYGNAFNLSQITKLTENEYEEKLVQEVKPDWNNKLRGTHTLNSDKDFTVIDVYSFRKRLSFK
jgi:hypothetical protein